MSSSETASGSREVLCGFRLSFQFSFTGNGWCPSPRKAGEKPGRRATLRWSCQALGPWSWVKSHKKVPMVLEKEFRDLQILHISWFSLNQTICHRFLTVHATWNLVDVSDFRRRVGRSLSQLPSSVPMWPSGGYERSNQVMEMCIFWDGKW